MKRLIYLSLVLLFVFTLNIYADPLIIEPSEGIDVILVIDTSGSMRTADPERITLEAASLFMDMMETRNSRIGIVGFSGSLHSVMPLTQINDPSIRDGIRYTISNFVFHGWTDIGLALRTAAEMILDDPEPGNSPMILLFTDGRIDLPENWPGRNIDISYADAWWAVDAVNAPIYTIGLNYDGTLNIEFLQDIANQTGARYYIAQEAAALPQIFNEIFADHIRSSIMEIATIVADGETYEDVFIHIPSAFVSEANIIMLSSRPIVNLRLFDPMGREISFDGETYTLTYANRYSMIKIIEPMVGEWLLRVQGLPQDHITVNLIHNYNIGVWAYVEQFGNDGAFFDPTQPITIQAGFQADLSQAQIHAIFNDTAAFLHVYDLDMNLIESVLMDITGTAFILEYLPPSPQDVRFNIEVTHPGFEQTTSFLTINFDPVKLAELLAIPDEPEPTPTPIPTPTPTPVVIPPEDIETGNAIVFILIGVALALVLAAFTLRAVTISQTHQKIFTGHLELRALLSDGKYTSLEAPDLSTFAGVMSFTEFLNNSLGNKSEKFINSGVPIRDISLYPGTFNNQPIVNLTNKGNCQISDENGNNLNTKKIVWENGRQLIFSAPGETAKLEATYRAYED